MKRFVKLIMLFVFATGCGRVDRDLSNDSHYMGVIGKQYRTKIELLVYRFKGNKFETIGESGGGIELPPINETKGKEFPYRYYDTYVFGVLPAGSEFRVAMVREEGAYNNAFIYYYVEITKSDDRQWVGKTVNVSSRIIASDDPLTFKSGITEEMSFDNN